MEDLAELVDIGELAAHQLGRDRQLRGQHPTSASSPPTKAPTPTTVTPELPPERLSADPPPTTITAAIAAAAELVALVAAGHRRAPSCARVRASS